MTKVRITGGMLRGQMIHLPIMPADLRPTGSRTKQTTFNWLNQTIVNSQVLDLFAGSGSLSFESLSRNAKSATMVEENSKLHQQIIQNTQRLKLQNQCQIINADALEWVSKNSEQLVNYSIIFLDPPFKSDYLVRLLQQLHPHLDKKCQIYIELPKANTQTELSQNTQIDSNQKTKRIKNKKAPIIDLPSHVLDKYQVIKASQISFVTIALLSIL